MRQELLDGAFVDVGFARGVSLQVRSFEGGNSTLTVADPDELLAIIKDYCRCRIRDLVQTASRRRNRYSGDLVPVSRHRHVLPGVGVIDQLDKMALRRSLEPRGANNDSPSRVVREEADVCLSGRGGADWLLTEGPEVLACCYLKPLAQVKSRSVNI